MRDYGYLADWPLSACNYPAKCVQTKAEDMTDFRVKGNPEPEYLLGFCKHLQDNYSLGQEGVLLPNRRS